MAKRDVGSSLSVQRCMQCGVGGNKKLVRQLRKPQTIKEGKRKRIHPRSVQTCGTCRTSRKKFAEQLRTEGLQLRMATTKRRVTISQICWVYGVWYQARLPVAFSFLNPCESLIPGCHAIHVASIHVFHGTTSAPGPILPKGVSVSAKCVGWCCVLGSTACCLTARKFMIPSHSLFSS